MLESYTPNPQVKSSLRTESRDDDCATRHRPRELHYGRIWSPERDEQLIALYTAVPPPKDLALAEAMGMRVSQVRGRLDVLRAAGVLSPRPKKAERKRRDAPPPTADDLRTALKARASALWPTERLLTLCLGWRAERRPRRSPPGWGSRTTRWSARCIGWSRGASSKRGRRWSSGTPMILAARPSPTPAGRFQCRPRRCLPWRQGTNRRPCARHHRRGSSQLPRRPRRHRRARTPGSPNAAGRSARWARAGSVSATRPPNPAGRTARSTHESVRPGPAV